MNNPSALDFDALRPPAQQLTAEIIAHPYMGIYEFRDGKIARWRDYFEMNNKKQG
jgi:limonene-1,2-epoxide hydrolase